MPPENKESLLNDSLPPIPPNPAITQPANNPPQPNSQIPVNPPGAYKKLTILSVVISLFLILIIGSFYAYTILTEESVSTKTDTKRSTSSTADIPKATSQIENSTCFSRFEDHLTPAQLGQFRKVGGEISDPFPRDINSNVLGSKKREISASYSGHEKENEGGLFLSIVEFKNSDSINYNQKQLETNYNNPDKNSSTYTSKKNIQGIDVYFTEALEPATDNPALIFKLMVVAFQIPDKKIRAVIQQIPYGADTIPLPQKEAESIFNE